MPLCGKSASLTLLLLAVWARCGSAQGPAYGSVLPVDSAGVASTAVSPLPDEADASLGAALLSLALPGAGQYRQGRGRAWMYLAVEATAWAVHLAEQAQGRRYRARYRDFAWTIARVHTSSRQDGDWAYYEALTKWRRSGSYDQDGLRPGTQPELDPTTFNGAVWALARDIYFPPGQTVSEGDPAYTRALEYYQARAYGPSFLWDWSSTPGAQAEYEHLIDKSDGGFRHATIALGAVFANHLVSSADAYLTGREPGEPSHLSIQPEMTGQGTRWTAHVRIPVSR